MNRKTPKIRSAVQDNLHHMQKLYRQGILVPHELTEWHLINGVSFARLFYLGMKPSCFYDECYLEIRIGSFRRVSLHLFVRQLLLCVETLFTHIFKVAGLETTASLDIGLSQLSPYLGERNTTPLTWLSELYSRSDKINGDSDTE
ncbi:hypothetical protein NPIL_116241 [Nephila pilipes]|uniref:Uncharacterized protein n=1 Tax=Nephila pilipes TaxID=299642 RepID=A0A8X6UG27_NEPPI|nr:hypothetical protein NPIL_116241 [Nephila pilipes]